MRVVCRAVDEEGAHKTSPQNKSMTSTSADPNEIPIHETALSKELKEIKSKALRFTLVSPTEKHWQDSSCWGAGCLGGLFNPGHPSSAFIFIRNALKLDENQSK